MRIVEPKAYLIGYQAAYWPGIHQFFSDRGLPQWSKKRESETAPYADGQLLGEIAGRISYQSFDLSMNTNLSRVREEQNEHLYNLVKQGHGSTFAHLNYNFILSNVTRVTTEELERHKVGTRLNPQGEEFLAEYDVDTDETNRSQESLRFVRLDDIEWQTPDSFKPTADWTDPSFIAHVRHEQEYIIQHQEKLAKLVGQRLDEEGASFHVKKMVTSDLRYSAPMGTCTDLMWSVNIRAARHIVESRTAIGAASEIRKVFGEVGDQLRDIVPDLFNDYVVNDHGEWVTKSKKV